MHINLRPWNIFKIKFVVVPNIIAVLWLQNLSQWVLLVDSSGNPIDTSLLEKNKVFIALWTVESLN